MPLPHRATPQQSMVSAGVIRARLTANLAAGGSAAALVVIYDQEDWTETTLEITIWDATGVTAAADGDLVYCKRFLDSGRFELITPPAAGMRLWRFTLNEALTGSPPTADADLLELDGTDTGEDITLYDYLSIFSADLSTDDAGYCLQIGSIYVAIQAPCP